MVDFDAQTITIALTILGSFGSAVWYAYKVGDRADSKADTMSARLWGNDERSTSGDINRLEDRVETLESRYQTLEEKTDTLEQDNDRVLDDLHGADEDNSRRGVVNEIHAMARTVTDIDRKLDNAERERQENSQRLDELADSVQRIQYGLATHPDFEHVDPGASVDGNRAADGGRQPESGSDD